MELRDASDFTTAMTAAVTATVGDRAAASELLTAFAAQWLTPIAPGDGYSEAELADAEAKVGRRLPAALREAYALYGKRKDLTASQDPLLAPEELYEFDGALVFREENQGVVLWGVPLSDVDAADPPVVHRFDMADEDQELWLPWSGLSAALLDAALAETAVHDDDRSDGTDWDDAMAAELTALPALLPPDCGSAWYFGHDALWHVLGGAFVMVRARTAKELEAALDAVLGEEED